MISNVFARQLTGTSVDVFVRDFWGFSGPFFAVVIFSVACQCQVHDFLLLHKSVKCTTNQKGCTNLKCTKSVSRCLRRRTKREVYRFWLELPNVFLIQGLGRRSRRLPHMRMGFGKR